MAHGLVERFAVPLELPTELPSAVLGEDIQGANGETCLCWAPVVPRELPATLDCRSRRRIYQYQEKKKTLASFNVPAAPFTKKFNIVQNGKREMTHCQKKGNEE